MSETTAEEREGIREGHVKCEEDPSGIWCTRCRAKRAHCRGCGDSWPCDAIRLLADLEAAEERRHNAEREVAELRAEQMRLKVELEEADEESDIAQVRAEARVKKLEERAQKAEASLGAYKADREDRKRHRKLADRIKRGEV